MMSGELVGSELVWLSDPFEVYVAHVQGSAKIRLPDGRLITVGYAANNGHEYKSIARKMVSDGVMRSDQISLKAMIDYFKARPGEAERYIAQNQRFVFFQMSQGDPRGSLNEPVIAMRTIATDKSIYPRGSLAFLSTELPGIADGTLKRKFTGFARIRIQAGDPRTGPMRHLHGRRRRCWPACRTYLSGGQAVLPLPEADRQCRQVPAPGSAAN